MTGHCIEKLSHSCGSSDGLQVFEEDGKISGYCFSCGVYVPDPYNGNPPYIKAKVKKTPEEIQAEVDEISSLPTLPLPHRKLEEWALKYFNVRVAVSEEDGSTPVAYFYPYEKDGNFVNFKGKLIDPKKYYRVGEKGECDPFGWRQAIASGAPKIFITEGEDDAIALYQALKLYSANGKWAELEPAVISLANGANSVENDLGKVFHDLLKFKEIVLVFDQDSAGEAAVRKALQLLPTASVAKLPRKDANQCVIDGFSNALSKAVLHQSDTPKNTRLVNASTLFASARKVPQWGYSWPWPALTEVTRGWRTGEAYYFGAGVKMGKGELRNSVANHIMTEHNMPIFMASLEEVNDKTVRLMVGKQAKKFFHDPKKEFDFDAYDKAAADIGDKLWLLDLYQHADWKTLRSDIVMAAHKGCKAAFIDPVTNIVNGLSAAETDVMLKEIAPDMSALARELDIALFVYCHLLKPDNGPPHERGGKVYSSQFAGSRAMMRSCNYMFGLEGDKNPEADVTERNVRHLILLEDREFGEVADIPLYWNEHTGIFTEMPAY